MYSDDENDDIWDYFRGEGSNDDQPEKEPTDEEIYDAIEELEELQRRVSKCPEKDDEAWVRYPKRWSTMMMLTELNDSTHYSDQELAEAAASLMQQARFECSWSDKWGELVFWPSDIPLDEVKPDVI